MPADPPHGCPGVVAAIDDVDVPFRYDDRLREYLIECSPIEIIHVINHCPLCGAKLPEPLHEEWFDRLWDADIDPRREPEKIPEPMRSGAWWRAEAVEG